MEGRSLTASPFTQVCQLRTHRHRNPPIRVTLLTAHGGAPSLPAERFVSILLRIITARAGRVPRRSLWSSWLQESSPREAVTSSRYHTRGKEGVPDVEP